MTNATLPIRASDLRPGYMLVSGGRSRCVEAKETDSKGYLAVFTDDGSGPISLDPDEIVYVEGSLYNF